MKNMLLIVGLALAGIVTAEAQNTPTPAPMAMMPALKVRVPIGILETARPDAIVWAVGEAKTKDLVIFDINGVLLMFSDAVLHKSYRPWVDEWFAREMPQLDDSARQELMLIVKMHANRRVVNPLITEAIANAKANVITLSCVPPAADILTYEKLRQEKLQAAGIDLGDPFPTAEGWEEATLHARYSHGMVNAAQQEKGPVLAGFLAYLQRQINNIVFVEDDRAQCESVWAACEKMGIPALCIQYTEAMAQKPTLDPVVADLQLRTLVTERVWLSDEEARAKLK